MVKAVTSIEEFRQLIGQDKVVVFDFWAKWCGPCKVISPIFERLEEQFPHVEFYKVDVDEAEEISQEVGIRAMPTFMAFKSGDKVKEQVGANPQGLVQLVQTAASN